MAPLGVAPGSPDAQVPLLPSPDCVIRDTQLRQPTMDSQETPMSTDGSSPLTEGDRDLVVHQA